MSAETLEYHHGKHHQAYVTKLNELIKGTEHEGKTLEELIQSTQGPIFNQAAQVWNHTFFWHSLRPQGGGAPTGELAEAITRNFGSFDAFKTAFTTAAVGQFGSGWAWLVQEGTTLKIVSTSNAENPLTKGQKPLLTIDVWEHAYYIDYRNARLKFVETFLSHLVNWDFASKNFASA